MSSSFDSGVPEKLPNLPFGWIEVDGKAVFAADYWRERAEKAEATLERVLWAAQGFRQVELEMLESVLND